MKSLETNFTLDNHVFTQLKRNDKAALYKRETSDGQFISYEVFAIMTKNDSEIYPNKTAISKWAFCPVSEDRANTWFDRFTAGDVVIPSVDPETGEVVEVVKDEVATKPIETNEVQEAIVQEDPIQDVLVQEAPAQVADPISDVQPVVVSTPDGGAVVTVAKVTKTKVQYVIPVGEFTADMFADANSLRRRKGIWARIQGEISAGRVQFLGQRKTGKARPTNYYSAVVTTPVAS